MALSLHTLAPAKGSRSRSFRIGRGYATGRGTTAGRGTKGQRARTGGRNGLKLKGLKQMLLAFPKARGFHSTFATIHAVPVERVMAHFSDGERVTLEGLKAKSLIPKSAIAAKMIGGGEVTKKLTFVGIRATMPVKAAIEKAGGVFDMGSKKKGKGKKESKASGKKAPNKKK